MKNYELQLIVEIPVIANVIFVETFSDCFSRYHQIEPVLHMVIGAHILVVQCAGSSCTWRPTSTVATSIIDGARAHQWLPIDIKHDGARLYSQIGY